MRALIGSFVHGNPTGFNRADGAGFELLGGAGSRDRRASTRTSPRVCSAPSRAGASSSPSARRAPGPFSKISPGGSSRPTATRSSPRPSATPSRSGNPSVRVREVDCSVNGSLTAFPQFSPRQTESSSIPMIEGDSEMRQHLRREAGDRGRGTECRERVPRVREFSLSRGLTGRRSAPSIGRHIPNTELLRRLVPILLIAFACIACAGFAFQLVQGKRAALEGGADRARASRRQRRAQSEGQDAGLERRLAGRARREPAQGRDQRRPLRPARRRRGQCPGARPARQLHAPEIC